MLSARKPICHLLGSQGSLHWQPPCCPVAPRLGCQSDPTGKGERTACLLQWWREAKRLLPICYNEQLQYCFASQCGNQLSTNFWFLFWQQQHPHVGNYGPQTHHRGTVSNPLSPASILPGLTHPTEQESSAASLWVLDQPLEEVCAFWA